MDGINDGLFGIGVTGRPRGGFAGYAAAEFRSDGVSIHEMLTANRTTYVDIRLRRQVDKNVFRFDPASEPRHSFKAIKPFGETLSD